VSGVTLLDELLPRFDFSERHHRVIDASTEPVWKAIEAVTLREMPLTWVLMGIRSVPDRLLGRPGLPSARDAPLLAGMFDLGFVRLAEDPGRELVAGVVAGVTEGVGEISPMADAAEFTAVERPGGFKGAMNFRLVDAGAGRTLLETETRIAANDERSRRLFRLYWLAIRGGSGAIRRDWLRAIARRAERGGGP
jgi:hypothetical protein